MGFGGGNMMSSLTPFRGTGLWFYAFQFPVFGGGIGSLTQLLGVLASCFSSNLISCDLLNLLRSFLFISIYIVTFL